ncbi:hypothetical protein, partial [Cohnella soli]
TFFNSALLNVTVSCLIVTLSQNSYRVTLSQHNDIILTFSLDGMRFGDYDNVPVNSARAIPGLFRHEM